MKRGNFNIYNNNRPRLSNEDFEKQMKCLEDLKFEKRKRKAKRKKI